MKLKELFDSVPIHSYAVLDIRDEEWNTLETIAPLRNWCDGKMLDEFEEYGECDVLDVRADVDCSGLLRIVVESSEKLVMDDHGWYYIAANGERYEIGELTVPQSDKTSDIAILYIDNDTQFALVDYIYGITGMKKKDLLAFCREAVSNLCAK